MDKHPLEDLSGLFLSDQNLSKSTIKSYKICYKYYVNYLKKHDIIIAKTSDVIKFRESLRACGHSTYYIYLYISALRSLYRYLRIHQKKLNLSSAYTYDIMVPIKNEKIKKNLLKPILTLEEARHLLTYTKVNRKIIYDYRNYAIICLMLIAGLSPYEVIHLKKEDYQILDGKACLQIRKRKTQNIDTVFLSKGVVDAIEDYLKKRKKRNPYLFISQNQTTKEGHLSRTFFYFMFEKVIKKCGLEDTKITPHSLRHTAAYLNLLRGGSIESTRKLLRHVEISSTMMYQNYLDKINDRAEEAIEAYILKEDHNDLDEDTFFHYYFLN